MSTFLISYDLHNKTRAVYDNLETAIRGLGDWCKPLDTVYVVNTAYSAGQVRDFLNGKIASDDRLLVITVKRDAAWSGISDGCANWMVQKLPTL